MTVNVTIPYHHDGGHIAALTSPRKYQRRQLATSCGDVPKPPPLTAAAAITAHLRTTSKSTHGRWQAVEAAHRHHPMLPMNASSYYKCAATIRAPSWCRPPRVAPPPAVTVYRANPTDSARSSNLAGAGAHATKKKVSQTAYSLCTTLFVKYDSAVDSMWRCSNHDFLDLTLGPHPSWCLRPVPHALPRVPFGQWLV